MYTNNHITPVKYVGPFWALDQIMDSVLELPGVKSIARHTLLFTGLSNGIWEVEPKFYARATRAQRQAAIEALRRAVRE